MAVEHSLCINARPYFNSSSKRTVNVQYTVPEHGSTPETGVLLLISGFEGDSRSHVYQKMRMEFSDRENLIVVQCDYFGYEFMGPRTMQLVQEQFSDMEHTLKQYTKTSAAQPDELKKRELIQDETPDNFCELGIFQALDNILALKSVLQTLAEQGFPYNERKIIAYGYSHGAYLALLCNALMPNLFSGILDNSGWIYPVYLYRPRICSRAWEDEDDSQEQFLFVLVTYLGRKWIDDLEIYNLRRHYSQFKNKARILSFHGEDDHLVPLTEKEHFIRKIDNASLYVIREEDVDHMIFSNTQHGMGSNFISFFYFALSMASLERPQSKQPSAELLWQPRTFSSGKYHYAISENLEISRCILP